MTIKAFGKPAQMARAVDNARRVTEIHRQDAQSSALEIARVQREVVELRAERDALLSGREEVSSGREELSALRTERDSLLADYNALSTLHQETCAETSREIEGLRAETDRLTAETIRGLAEAEGLRELADAATVRASTAESRARLLELGMEAARVDLEARTAESLSLGSQLGAAKGLLASREHFLRDLITTGNLLADEDDLTALGIDPHGACPACDLTH